MKKNKLKTLYLIPAAMGLVLISGCQANNDNAQQTGDPSSTAKPLKVTWYAQTHSLNKKLTKSMGDLLGIQEMEKRLNTTIDFQEPAGGEETLQQFNVMLSGGTYPDVISWDFNTYPGGLSKLVDDKVALKLNDLIDKYAPNYKKILDQNPQIRKQIQLDDGTIASFTKIELDVHRLSYAGFFIRQDWLDKVGMKMPTTLDQWHDVLVAFKTKDPNGNGQQDEIPLGEFNQLNAINEFATAFGIRTDFYLDHGKVAFGPEQPAYKNFLATMAQWYKEGLIDNEFASLDRNAFDAKFTNNRVGAFSGKISDFGNYSAAMKEKFPGYKLVAAPDPIGPAGKSYSNNNAMVNFADGPSTLISTSNKDPIDTVKMIDYMYGQEGGDLMNWGILGDSYEVKDGKKVFTDKILKNTEGLSPSDYIKKWALPGNSLLPKVMDTNAWEQVSVVLPEAKDALQLWAKSDTSLLIPSFTLNPDESQQFSNIMNDVNTYMSEMVLKFIMGVQPISKFDDYVAQLKKMGVDNAVKIKQTAYDRFNARK